MIIPLVFQGGGSFYAENVTFYKILVFYSLGTVSFNKCIFTSGDSTLADTEGLYIADVHNLTISNCLFRNDAQADLIGIEDVSHVEISRCEFYQNKGQHELIVTLLVYLFHMDNCSIYGNDVKDAIYHSESHNFESMFTITNCRSLIAHPVGTFR